MTHTSVAEPAFKRARLNPISSSSEWLLVLHQVHFRILLHFRLQLLALLLLCAACAVPRSISVHPRYPPSSLASSRVGAESSESSRSAAAQSISPLLPTRCSRSEAHIILCDLVIACTSSVKTSTPRHFCTLIFVSRHF